ncbi:MAG: glycerol dehydrogenase [Firmicutes bacterium]|nr:glycerol dehydrogenase [Bacillota bacterium]
MLPHVMVAPHRYVQGEGVLRDAGTYVSMLGDRALVLADPIVLQLVGEYFTRSLVEKDIEPTISEFKGECSESEINRLVSVAREARSNVVVGIGGGKALDTAKAVGFYLNIPEVIVPTIASSDAPCSAASILYSNEGAFDKILFYKKSPEMVLVDTRVIANAPSRFLVAGMGDALATKFEAEACLQANARNTPGGLALSAAIALADLCFKNVIQFGIEAKLAVDHKLVTPAVERVVEANILLSGLGFESGGLAAAHSIHNGLTTLPQTHCFLHGEKVAFATIAQLIMEGRPLELIGRIIYFCSSVGLPTTLADIGLANVTEDELNMVAKAACAPGESIHNMPFPVDPGAVKNALYAVDVYSGLCKSHDYAEVEMDCGSW